MIGDRVALDQCLVECEGPTRLCRQIEPELSYAPSLANSTRMPEEQPVLSAKGLEQRLRCRGLRVQWWTVDWQGAVWPTSGGAPPRSGQQPSCDAQEHCRRHI